MDNQTVIGIGCFAKPARLSRIFNKLVQDYALGPFEGDQLFDQNIPEHQKITGFYLSLFDQKLNLAIFARGSSFKQKIYTAKLDGLTKLRQERLN